MNEYRVPELNVQNGVLKSMSFMFEYIGEMGKDYVHAVTPLLEDALIDLDLVHRQTAIATVKHVTLGVHGLGCEDALVHLINYVWPNIFESSMRLRHSGCPSAPARFSSTPCRASGTRRAACGRFIGGCTTTSSSARRMLSCRPSRSSRTTTS